MRLSYIHICWTFVLLNFNTISAQHINNTDTSTSKKRMEYQLRKSLDQSDYKKALEITDSMELYGIKNKDSIYMAIAYDAKTTLYRFKRDIRNAKINVKKGISIYEKYHHYSELIKSNSYLAKTLRDEGKLDSCFYTLNKINRLYISDTVSKGSLRYFYNEKEASHSVAGRIDSSLHYSFKRIGLIEEDNYFQLGVSYLILTENFYKVNDLKKALNYINESLHYFSKDPRNLTIATCKAYILKGNILLALKQYQEVKLYAHKALDLIKNKDLPNYKVQIEVLLFKLNGQIGKPHKIPVLDVTDIKNKKITNSTLFDFYLAKLKYSVHEKKWKEARVLIEKLHLLIPNISDLNLKQTFHQLSSLYWAEVKDFEKSYYEQNQYFKIKEKINTRQHIYTAYDLDQKYQLAKKNEEIVNQNFRIQTQENELLKKEKHQIYLTLSILSAILGFILLLFIYRQRQKIKNNEIITLQHQQEVIKLESLIDGEEKERNRLAQDLHDGINGDLSAIKYKITSIAPSKLNEKEKIIHHEAIQMLDNTVEQVRRISHNLAPSSLLNFNLVEVIQQFCDRINSSNPLNTSFQYFGKQFKLEKEKETVIYRIIQELTNNIIKHANATEALIQINSYENKLHITVEDNGIGFDPDVKSHGIGLQNIKSRVSLLNANLDIHSSAEGTSFNIEIYLDKI